MGAPIIITQLPSPLIDSPLFSGFYDLDDMGVDTLQKDLEESFDFNNQQDLESKILRINMLGSVKVNKFPTEIDDSFDRLLACARMSTSSTDSLFWILKLIHNLLSLSKRYNIHAYHLFLEQKTSGAFLVPTTCETFGDSLPSIDRLEGLRRRLHSKVRADIRDQFSP